MLVNTPMTFLVNLRTETIGWAHQYLFLSCYSTEFQVNNWPSPFPRPSFWKLLLDYLLLNFLLFWVFSLSSLKNVKNDINKTGLFLNLFFSPICCYIVDANHTSSPFYLFIIRQNSSELLKYLLQKSLCIHQ